MFSNFTHNLKNLYKKYIQATGFDIHHIYIWEAPTSYFFYRQKADEILNSNFQKCINFDFFCGANGGQKFSKKKIPNEGQFFFVRKRFENHNFVIFNYMRDVIVFVVRSVFRLLDLIFFSYKHNKSQISLTFWTTNAIKSCV